MRSAIHNASDDGFAHAGGASIIERGLKNSFENNLELKVEEQSDFYLSQLEGNSSSDIFDFVTPHTPIVDKPSSVNNLAILLRLKAK